MKRAVYLLVFLMFFSNCQGQEEQLDCLDATMQNEELKPIFLDLRKGLEDTLKDWIYNKKYERVQIFKSVKWQIDEAVFISPQKDKALLLVLEQDTAKFISDSEPSLMRKISAKLKSTRFDYVHMLFANKEIDGWHFYYQSLPMMVLPREKQINNIPVPLSFKELSLIGRRNVLKEYYRRGTCEYNEVFFSRWDIKNLKEKHKKINGYY